MTRRNPRDGLRDRWVSAVAGCPTVGSACKLLMFYLVATNRVTPRGFVTFKRDTVAGELGVHPQRITDRIKEARNAGLLDRVGGGYEGRTAEYAVTVPAYSAVTP